MNRIKRSAIERRRVSRRAFLGAIGSSAVSLMVACTRTFRATSRLVGDRPPGPFSALRTPANPVVRAEEGIALELAWNRAPRALSYDLELNGTIIAQGLGEPHYELRFGQGKPGFQEGKNTWRARAVNNAGDSWSQESTFEVTPVGVIRTRHFDEEDDGNIALTVAGVGATIVVGSDYTFGSAGKGVVLRADSPKNASAYKNLVQLPVDECWIRLAIRPHSWSRNGASVNLARIRSKARGVSEHLVWRTGGELRSTSIAPGVPIPTRTWIQAQLGVRKDGSVELWAFDGRREALIGSGRNHHLRGLAKDLVSIGNDDSVPGSRFEVWLDELAVGHSRLPWAHDTPREPIRPSRLDADALPDKFSFVFGSCNVSTRVPYTDTALAAAAKTNPDFMIHLGDFGYPDTGAYGQTESGYRAFWSDLVGEEYLSSLIKRPWISLASDHDMGGNNVDRNTLAQSAARAFAQWNANDTSAHPDGLYGSVGFDGGRVLLIWLEGIRFRTPLNQPDGELKTMLGSRQKAWLLNLLRSSHADLIIIASQTTFGHVSDTSWIQYPTERREVFDACLAARGTVRWISGDHHAALWAAAGTKLAEWGAAPLAEIPQTATLPASLMTEGECVAATPFTQRADTLRALSREQINNATSFGRVEINTRKHTARFEIRDNRGRVRVTDTGFRMEETIRYA